MHKWICAGALGLGLAAAAPALAAVDPDELAELKRQVAALAARVEALEAENARLAGAAPAAPAVATAPVASAPAVPAAAAAAPAGWFDRLRIDGDLRYRHDHVEDEGRPDRDRQRIRARLGLTADLGESLTAGLRLATGDATNPRSTNVTFGDSNQRKDVGLDLAYVAWRARPDLVLTLGKQAYPWLRASGSMLYDSDVNPEGLALAWGGRTGPFLNAWALWLQEQGAGADANLVGAQLGWSGAGGLTLAASYHDYGAMQGSSFGYSGYPAGNTTFAGDAGCNLPAPATGALRCLAYDYDILGLTAQYATRLGRLPLVLWAEYLENLEAPGDDSGYSVGATLGRARDPGSWELRLMYQDVGADAQWGGMTDSNFGGGATQARGVLIRGGYVPAKNLVLNLSLFENSRDYDRPGERDFRLLQLDLNLRF